MLDNPDAAIAMLLLNPGIDPVSLDASGMMALILARSRSTDSKVVLRDAYFRYRSRKSMIFFTFSSVSNAGPP